MTGVTEHHEFDAYGRNREQRFAELRQAQEVCPHGVPTENGVTLRYCPQCPGDAPDDYDSEGWF